jgi:outer membrane protein TolC
MRPKPAPRAERILTAMLLLLATLLWPQPGSAASETVHLQPTPADDLPKADLDIEDDGIHLGLDDAIEIALRRDLGLLVERYNWTQTNLGVLQDLGIYDLNAYASLSSSDSTQPSSQVIEGVGTITTKNQAWNLGLSQLLPTGGTVNVTLLSANKTSSNNKNLPLNPLYSANSSVTLTQPLLQGVGRLATNRQILVARTNAAQSEADFEQQVSILIQDVDSAYWNLVEAQDQLGVAHEALDLAKTLHEQNKVRVEVGTLAPLELIQSQAGIAGREEDIIRAESAVGDAADHLRQLLNLDQGPLWDKGIIPTTDPKAQRLDVNVDDAIKTALADRPEIASLLHQIDGLKISQRYSRNQLLPQLDLRVDYGLAGQAGKNPNGGGGDLSDAVHQIRGRDFDSWRAQLTVSYPIQNRQARAQAAIAEAALEQGRARLAQLKQQVLTDVRTAVRQVQTTAKQIDSAKISRELEEKNLDAERKRYENGMSSSFQVLQIQDDLTQARSREVSAITAYRRALAGYYYAIGRLIHHQGVEIDAGGDAY